MTRPLSRKAIINIHKKKKLHTSEIKPQIPWHECSVCVGSIYCCQHVMINEKEYEAYTNTRDLRDMREVKVICVCNKGKECPAYGMKNWSES